MTRTTITRSELEALVPFEAHAEAVRQALQQAAASPQGMLRFLARYTSWNGCFGSGVATLAGKIGRTRGLFLDPEQRPRAVADRSVYVASFFFDAARDEFDDRDTVHRDTHRCLAQATLLGSSQFLVTQDRELAKPAVLEKLTTAPAWLLQANRRVAQGYGAMSEDNADSMFRAMGYHLGSELLADQEFSLIDSTLREHHPKLVKALQKTKVEIAGQRHVAYTWIAIHSGHGGAVEADHFAWATTGAQRALRFTPPARRAAARKSLHAGFRAFAQEHSTFFSQVNRSR